MNKSNFGFFKQEIEADGIEILSAAELKDPDPNFSGSYALDFDLSTPFPEGRVIEIYGPEGSCKTTLALEVAGQALQKGKLVLYVNMEKNLNLSLMMTIRTIRPFLQKAIEKINKGKFDPSDCPLWIVKASNGEQAFEVIRKFSQMYPKSIAILDSIDAAQPESVLSEEVGENKMGNLGKLLSDAMRKLITPLSQNDSTLILINQVRDKMNPYGNPHETSGGRAVKFYASQRIELMKPGKAQIIVDQSGERIGVIIRYKIVKNKSAPDGIEGEFPILLKNGIFREHELVSECLKFGLLKFGGRGGKQVVMSDNVILSQFDAARRLLLDAKLSKELDERLRLFIKPGKTDAVDALLNNEIQKSE